MAEKVRIIKTKDIRDELLTQEKALCEAEEDLEDKIIGLIMELKNLRMVIKETREEINAYDEAKEKIEKLLSEI